MNTLGLLGVGSHLTVGSSHLVEGKFLHLLESQLTGLLFSWKMAQERERKLTCVEFLLCTRHWASVFFL